MLTLLLLIAIALCMAIAPLAAGAIGLGAGLALGGRKKKKDGFVYPHLEVPYLSEQQIRGSPILSPMYDVWQQLAQTVSATPPPTLTSEVMSNLARLATSRPDIFSSVGYVSTLMRPLFEQQLGRQLAMTHEQLARALGTPTGGAIAEMLRRQIAEAEQGWMSQLGQMGFQELQAQRGLMQWATEALPRMMSWQVTQQFLPLTMLAQTASPFIGTFVSPQQIVRQPSMFEQLLPAIILGGILGGFGG
jgi:hypothetical protein